MEKNPIAMLCPLLVQLRIAKVKPSRKVPLISTYRSEQAVP